MKHHDAKETLNQMKQKKDNMKQRISNLNESMSKKHRDQEVSDEITLNNIEINELAQQRALMKQKLETLNCKFNRHKPHVLEEQSATS